MRFGAIGLFGSLRRRCLRSALIRRPILKRKSGSGIASSDHRERKWESYPAAGPANLACLPRFPDLVLDGRFRVACALAIALAAKDRSQDFDLLFDDYELRPHYAVVERYLPAPTVIGRSRLFSVKGSEIDFARVAASFRGAIDDYR